MSEIRMREPCLNDYLAKESKTQLDEDLEQQISHAENHNGFLVGQLRRYGSINDWRKRFACCR